MGREEGGPDLRTGRGHRNLCSHRLLSQMKYREACDSGHVQGPGNVSGRATPGTQVPTLPVECSSDEKEPLVTEVS